jgi:hypothetical protein
MSDKIYCALRKEWVVSKPEEKIRQQLIQRLIHELGFPSSYLVLEKDLRMLPHLQMKGRQIPERRADIICFANDIHPQHALYPLLLIECKAVELSEKVVSQVTGYNHFVEAYFVAIANEKEIKTGWYDDEKGDYVFVNYLPRYEELIKSLS